jgi:hypothetical protein
VSISDLKKLAKEAAGDDPELWQVFDLLDVNSGELVGEIREHLRDALILEIGARWLKQHPDERWPYAHAPITVTFDHVDVQLMCETISRRLARVVGAMVVKTKEQ